VDAGGMSRSKTLVPAGRPDLARPGSLQRSTAAAVDRPDGVGRPWVESDARRLLTEITTYVGPEPGAVELDQIWQVGAFLAHFVQQHEAIFGEDALRRVGEATIGVDGPVSLSGAKGFYHLAQQHDPDLWLSLFEFAAGEPTTIHDHATWGVILALGGRNHVRLFERSEDAGGVLASLTLVREWTLERGRLAWWFDPPRNIHQQEALGDAPAYALVLMGHDPTNRMQRQYDPDTGQAELVPYRRAAARPTSASHTVAQIAAEHVAPHAGAVDRERRFPAEAIEGLASAGLLGLMIPAEHGGLGGGHAALVEACATLAEACASTGLCFLMHCCGSVAVAAGSDDAQKLRYLASLATGRALATIAFGGEADASAALTTRHTAAGLRLSGRKRFVTGGDRVDLVLVLAGDDMYVVEADRPGVSFEGRWEGLGMTGNNSTTLVLEDVPVDPGSLVGGPGAGPALRQTVIRPHFLLGLAGVNLGIATAAFNTAVAQARLRRSADGTRRGDAPAVQLHLAEMQCRIDAASAVVHRAAAGADRSEPGNERLTREAKLIACDAAVEVSQSALLVCGGAGYAARLPVERNLRDAHAGRLMTPSDDELRAAIGLELIDAR
jgi:alkylation response protein AidB-like acyl-CoA dehydrogenase